jgi:DNA-binding NtrC family response regulator
VRDHRGSSIRRAGDEDGAIDPIAGGVTAASVALVIGKSESERESVARALHREQRGPDGVFLRIDCSTDEGLLQRALQSWLVGMSGVSSPQLLNRLEGGSLFLDGIEALGVETQALLLDFLIRPTRVTDDVEGASAGPSQPWKGQLIAGSVSTLRRVVRDRGWSSGLAEHLEQVRIVLDPDDVDSRES